MERSVAENGGPKEMVTLTVDGQEVEVSKGATLLDAAKSIGVKVPHYCYHGGIPSAPAMCRMCLVEVEGAPKLMPACVTQAQDGQTVATQSEKALEMRKGVLEFYLKNHPLDCPICDQSGECKLQDYVFAEGRKHGRSREPKRVFGRDDFGGDILFYGDRCVMCTRCVRFMSEVAQDPLLTVVERGSRSVIDTFFEEGLTGSPYAGNIVDICPVGALVSKDFLHKARAWDLDHTPSVCTSCSQGCNTELHTRDNLVQRLKPRKNAEVNGHWMCDYGRHNYEWINRGDRIEVPLVREDEGMKAMGWREALEELLGRLRSGVDVVGSDGSGSGPADGHVSPRGAGPVRAVGSPFASNEDLGGLLAFVDALGGGETVFRSTRAADEEPLPGFPQLVRRRDLAPNIYGAELLGLTRVGDDEGRGGIEGFGSGPGILFVLGDELLDQDESFGFDADLFVYLGSYPCEAATRADFVLPVTTFAEQEGTFTNHEGRVQRFWPGLKEPGAARPAWLVLHALVSELAGGAVPTKASEAFARLADRSPAFEGLDFQTLGTKGALLEAPATAGTGH